MTGFIEDAFLRSEGWTDEDIANFNKILPTIIKLVEDIQKDLPLYTAVAPVLLPLMTKILKKQQELK